MITDGVTDIKNAVIKAHFEKDEAKKVLKVFDWVLGSTKYSRSHMGC